MYLLRRLGRLISKSETGSAVDYYLHCNDEVSVKRCTSTYYLIYLNNKTTRVRDHIVYQRHLSVGTVNVFCAGNNKGAFIAKFQS